MTTRILTEVTTSISELKANPMKVALSADREPVAVLKRNKPAFYCIPAKTYESLMDYIEDRDIMAIAEVRKNEENIKIDINDL